MFVQRAHGKTDDLVFLSNQRRLALEEEMEAKQNKRAPWLIHPKKSSFYKFWLLIVTFVLQFEIFCVSLVLVWPEIKQDFGNLFWFCDAVWVVSIPIDFITIRLNIVSRDNFDIAANYIQSEFLFDLIATFPTMFSNHSNKLIFLRFLHVIHLHKTSLMLDMSLEILIHYSTIIRNKVNVSIRLAYLILFGVHFCVVLWLYIGTGQSLSSSEKHWIKQDHHFESYSHYQLYVLSIYWIFTLVTTVGYGDLVGITNTEYSITVFLEFGGFLVQSGFFWLILQLLKKNYDYSICLSVK